LPEVPKLPKIAESVALASDAREYDLILMKSPEFPGLIISSVLQRLVFQFGNLWQYRRLAILLNHS